MWRTIHRARPRFISALLLSDLPHQIINNPFKWVESERLPNRHAKIRVRVHIIENHPTVSRLQIFNSADVKTTLRNNSLSDVDSRPRDFPVGIKLDWFDWRLLRTYTMRITS